MPEGCGLADADDAASAEESGTGGFEGRVEDRSGPDLAGGEAGSGGVVVVAVGGGHAAQDILGALGLAAGRQDGGDPDLRVERDAGDLLAYQLGVVDGRAFEEPRLHPPGSGDARHDAEPQQGGLPRLPGLQPLVALEGGQRAQSERGHAEAASLGSAGMGVCVLRVPGVGALVDEALVVLRPSGAEGAQEQACDDAFPGVQVGERTEQRDERVRAGVGQVGVAEGAQGHVLGTGGAQGHRPCLLAVPQMQGVVLRHDLVDARLGVVGRDLGADDLSVLAAGHEGDAVGVARELEGEGFRHGDGAEKILDAEERALAGARRGHGQ